MDTLKLTVNHGIHNVITETACESFTWHGHTYTSSGTYTHAYSNSNGCASVDTLKLTVHYGTHNVVTETACESFIWHGQTYTTSGTYTHAYTNADGCASVDTLKLTVNYSATHDEHLTLCDNELPYHYVNGQIDTTFDTGTPSLSTLNFNFSTIHGCDSTVTLHLIIHPTAFTMAEDSIYVTQLPYQWHGLVIAENGIYYDTLQTIHGCDSICQLTLSIYGTGIDNPASTSLQVYPNPASSHINIKGLNLMEMSLFDVRGALLRVYPANDTESLSLPLSDYADGIYILRIRFRDGTTTSRRIVIKR